MVPSMQCYMAERCPNISPQWGYFDIVFVMSINVICMVKYEGCWPMGSVQTGRALLQLCNSPFKYLKALR